MAASKTKKEALEYIKKNVPAQVDNEKINLKPLKKQLFDASKDIPSGSYEFEGEHGLKISFEFVVDRHHFDNCFLVFNGVSGIEGEYHPINAFIRLTIQTKHFQYNLSDHKRPVSIYWLPNLRNEKSELSNSFLRTASSSIYLIDKDGLFSRPIDLLGYFHEIGHLETGSGGPISVMGMRVDSPESDAKELKGEYDANEWMRSNTEKLFKDLKLSNALEDYTHLQIRSYHARLRRLYLED